MSITFRAFKHVEHPEFPNGIWDFVEGSPEINMSNSNAFSTFQRVFKTVQKDSMDYAGHFTREQLDDLRYQMACELMDYPVTAYVMDRFEQMFKLIEWVQEQDEEVTVGWS